MGLYVCRCATVHACMSVRLANAFINVKTETKYLICYEEIPTFYRQATCRLLPTQSALEFCPIHCPNGRLGQDLGFGGIAFALKLPELLTRNLAAVRAKLGQRSCFPNGPQIWCPIGQ